MHTVFADTFYDLAVLNVQDQHHAAAQELARQRALRFVTTPWVLVEVADAFASSPARRRIGAFVERLRANPKVEIVSATEQLFDRGLALYDARSDKNGSLTDCIAFVVMQDEGIGDALTGGPHFEQAGFNALLA